MSGFPTWGSDVGGYAGPPFDDAELFVRWAQLGAVSPVMEVGGIGGERDAVDARAGRDERPARGGRAPLRALPVPLRAARSAPAGAPPARLRLSRTTRPRGGRTTSCSSAPTCSRRRSTGPGTTPSVYLPPGSWVDLYTGAIVKGGGADVHALDAAARSSRSTRAPARSCRSTCARRPAPGGAWTS